MLHERSGAAPLFASGWGREGEGEGKGKCVSLHKIEILYIALVFFFPTSRARFFPNKTHRVGCIPKGAAGEATVFVGNMDFSLVGVL